MENLKSLINKLEDEIEYSAVSNHKISKSSVGWHIEHTLLTTNLIINAIAKSNPAEYKSKFRFAKLFVFTFNKIPRGKIQAPSSVTPVESFTIEGIKNNFITCHNLMKKLSSLNDDNFFEHPFFGHLNLKPSVKFLKIHTKHHLSIINDILKSTKKGRK